MSRHNVNLEDGGVLTVGYDRPMSEYFVQLFDAEDEIVFSIASVNTMKCHPEYPGKLRWSNGELLEVLVQYPVPESLINGIALDLEI